MSVGQAYEFPNDRPLLSPNAPARARIESNLPSSGDPCNLYGGPLHIASHPTLRRVCFGRQVRPAPKNQRFPGFRHALLTKPCKD